MVKFSTEINPDTIPLASQLMTGIVAWETWRKRITALEADVRSNPYWEAFLLERHGLELGFGALKRRLQTTNRVPWPPRKPEEYRLYSFLAVAVRVHANLSQAGALTSSQVAGRLELKSSASLSRPTSAARFIAVGFMILEVFCFQPQTEVESARMEESSCVWCCLTG
jgi:hypothetical protein